MQNCLLKKLKQVFEKEEVLFEMVLFMLTLKL
jgi:hypothetical protein